MWFAVQNGTGPWTRVTPSNNTFTFTLGPTGAYAVVTRNGADTVTSVMYATATEIASIAAATPCGPDPATGTKRMNGTMLNASTANQTVSPTIIVGGAQFTKTSDSTNAFTLIGVPSGSRDLIAASIHSAANVEPNAHPAEHQLREQSKHPDARLDRHRVVQSPALGAHATQSGRGSRLARCIVAHRHRCIDSYYSTTFLGSAGNTAFAAIPDSLLRPSDFHDVSISASPGTGSDYRVVELLIHSANVTTPTPVSFGPRVAGIAVSTISTSPYLRLRGQAASQGAYTAGAIAYFAQGNRTVSVGMTAGYVGTAPATWMLDIPDLTTAGYDPSWALKSGQAQPGRPTQPAATYSRR